jgi:hypothetical protein
MVHDKKIKTIGSRAEVWHGTAKKTSGGITKAGLLQNKHGRIVSRAQHNRAKRENRLVKAGYGTKKGKFGFVLLHGKKSRKNKSKRGGSVGGTFKNDEPEGYTSTGVASTAESFTGGKRKSRKGKGSRKGSKSRKQRGGVGGQGYALSPASYAGQGQGLNSDSDAVQFAAGNSG